MTLCNICSESKKTIRCCFCEESACIECIHTWLFEINSPACMFCRKEWSLSDLQRMLSNKWFKTIRSETLIREFKLSCEEEKRHILESMGLRKKTEEELETVRLEQRKAISVLREIDEKVVKLKNIIDFPHLYRNTHLRGPCQNNGCPANLNDNNFCELCDRYTCLDCKEVFGTKHKCNQLIKASNSEIVRSCHECPVCNVNITKIEGCDQMWCTQCKTSFDWKTNRIIKLTSRFHNPHYQQQETDDEVKILEENLNKVTYAKLRSILIKNEQKLEYSQTFVFNLLNVKKNCSEMMFTINYLRTKISQNTDIELKVKYVERQVSDSDVSRILVRRHISASKNWFSIECLKQYIVNASELFLFANDQMNERCIEQLNLGLASLEANFFKCSREFAAKFSPSYFKYSLDEFGRFY